MRPSQLEQLVVSDRFRAWQSSLIYEKNKFRNQESEEAATAKKQAEDNQKKLDKAVNNGPRATYRYMLESFSKVNPDEEVKAQRSVPSLPVNLTVDEMSRLPTHAERMIEKELTKQGLTPAVAAEPHFWALSHAFWIAEEVFGPDIASVFLAGPGAGDSEARTRNFLRRTGGLPGVRGSTSVLTDCPLSVAWWRCRMARQVAERAEREGSHLDFKQAHEVLYLRQVWTGIVDYAVRRVTVINAPRARASVVVAIAQIRFDTGENVTTDQVRSSVQHLAKLGQRYNLHRMAWNHLVEEALYGFENPVDRPDDEYEE